MGKSPRYAILMPFLVLVVACTGPRQLARVTVLPDSQPGIGPAAPAAAADTGRKGYTLADVRFMQGMISHHAQAITMADMVSSRTSRQDLRLLAERIDVSQKSEIELMQRWLRSRGEEVPSPEAHEHAGHATLMPGMLTQAELDQLARATDVEFERLFLQFMIHHHEGALTMVQELFASPRSGQDAEIFLFASGVDADQIAEIRRMRALQSALPGGAR